MKTAVSPQPVRELGSGLVVSPERRFLGAVS
jgi:hypothetical protein